MKLPGSAPGTPSRTSGALAGEDLEPRGLEIGGVDVSERCSCTFFSQKLTDIGRSRIIDFVGHGEGLSIAVVAFDGAR